VLSAAIIVGTVLFFVIAFSLPARDHDGNRLR
jgi:hypothetical protein